MSGQYSANYFEIEPASYTRLNGVVSNSSVAETNRYSQIVLQGGYGSASYNEGYIQIQSRYASQSILLYMHENGADGYTYFSELTHTHLKIGWGSDSGGTSPDRYILLTGSHYPRLYIHYWDDSYIDLNPDDQAAKFSYSSNQYINLLYYSNQIKLGAGSGSHSWSMTSSTSGLTFTYA